MKKFNATILLVQGQKTMYGQIKVTAMSMLDAADQAKIEIKEIVGNVDVLVVSIEIEPKDAADQIIEMIKQQDREGREGVK